MGISTRVCKTTYIMYTANLSYMFKCNYVYNIRTYVHACYIRTFSTVINIVMHYRLLAVTMYWSQEWKLMPVVFVMEITTLLHLYLIQHLQLLILVNYKLLYYIYVAMCMCHKQISVIGQSVTLICSLA